MIRKFKNNVVCSWNSTLFGNRLILAVENRPDGDVARSFHHNKPHLSK